MKQIVIKVNINCQLCKADVLKAVTKLTGIDSVAVDGGKGTLTVVGDVDPVLVVKRLRKSRKTAQIISVGPPKRKDDEQKGRICLLPSCCNQCQLVAVKYSPYDGGIGCHIL